MKLRQLSRIVAPLVAGVALAACATIPDSAPTLPSALEAGWKGERVCELLHETDTHRILRCTFPPGVGHERHFHPAHFGYALSGGTMRLTDQYGTRTVEIAAGSSFSNPGVPWHEGVNIGETTVAYVMIEQN